MTDGLARTDPNRFRHAVAVTALLSLMAGCATPVGVTRVSEQTIQRELTSSVLNSGEPSAFSMQFLQRLNLGALFEWDAPAALAILHGGLDGPDERDRLFALAELSFAHAERNGDRPYYLSAVVYAYAYLFPSDPQMAPAEYDPRLRLALDLYNRGLAAGLSTPDEQYVRLRARTVALPFGSLALTPASEEFHWGSYLLEDFISVADFHVRGLRNHYRSPGIGAPLAAVAIRPQDGKRAVVEKWIAPRTKVPVTAFVRFDPDLRQEMRNGAVHGTIELYAQDAATTVQCATYVVPLEFDTTATLAYRLEGSPLWDSEIAGFRAGDFRVFGKESDRGLFMFEPYRPGLIPVVFVHGTASSPARWAEMANELRADQGLGGRYQFWYFIYNTGNPIAYSASLLRRDLTDAVREIDPMGIDPALQRMVIIGHSQGGLLTKMLVVNSGDAFWKTVSERRFRDILMSDETRELLHRALFVEPAPFVRRVIFIATPHHGSYLADNWLGYIARKLVSMPSNITRVGLDIVKLNPGDAFRTAVTLPTSIDNMKWSNPFMKTLAALPIAPGITAHSIIPVLGNGPPDLGEDGVVRYSSAHIEGVASELVVRSGHSTQGTPETIEEVRRILYEHLDGAAPAAP
jgi:pimeloyl-ACP methyl ester carboxylesterase